MDIYDATTAQVVLRAIGEELRRAREAAGWTRAQFVSRLPCGIGERTVLSYEYGSRSLSVLRFLELCDVLGVVGSVLLSMALQRAQLFLANLKLHVDLRAMLDDESTRFRPLVQWARNRLNRCPDGIAEVTPASVSELADVVGCTHKELAVYLAKFIPDDMPASGIAKRMRLS